MIDLTPKMNLAMDCALQQAQQRANREQRGMNVYVAGPDAPEQAMANTLRVNVWYVRPMGEPAPLESELYRTVAPSPNASVKQVFEKGRWS